MSDFFSDLLTDASAAAEVAAASAIDVPTPVAAFDGLRTEPTPAFVLPVAPATKSLYPYQVAAVESILGHRRVLLGLQPGLGKTAIMQAAAAAEVAKGRRILVIVPPSLRVSPWANDFALDYPQLKVTVVAGQKAAEIDPTADVVIVGDSILTHRMDDIRAWAPQGVFVDEAHRFKNRDAKRSKALEALADELPVGAVVVPATGTLVANRVVDVYQPLRISGIDNARKVSGGTSWTRFMDAWCQTEMVWTGRTHVRVATGCRDAEGLRAALTSSCYVSVPREAVLDLPPRTTAVRSLVINGEAAAYRKAEKNFLQWVAETKGNKAMQRAQKAEAITKLMALWELDGLAKVKATAEYVVSMVEQGEPVVVMANHRSVVTKLYAALTDAGLDVDAIVGGMGSQAKADVVADFQNGYTDVVIGNIDAAGTGLTLHRAAHIVFAQLPWAPGVYGQACARIYRIGQERHVTTHVLNLNEGVSEHLWAVLANKAETADAVNTGTPSTIDSDSVIADVLSSYGWQAD